MFKNKKILFVGAHPDDLEFGCGATMANLDGQVVVLSDSTNVNGDTITKELESSMKLYDLPYIVFRDIETMKFYKYEDIIKQRLFELKKQLNPDIVFCPSFRSDNLDHRYTSAFVRNVFQEQSILMYEVIRGDYHHRANLWNEVSSGQLCLKLAALGRYQTQKKRDYMDFEAITAMAKFRGSQIGKPFAETFEVVRLIV